MLLGWMTGWGVGVPYLLSKHINIWDKDNFPIFIFTVRLPQTYLFYSLNFLSSLLPSRPSIRGDFSDPSAIIKPRIAPDVLFLDEHPSPIAPWTRTNKGGACEKQEPLGEIGGYLQGAKKLEPRAKSADVSSAKGVAFS